MAGRAIILSLLAVAGVAAQAGQPAEAQPSIIPGSFIVEYEDGQADTATFRRSIASDAQVKMALEFDLFKGASIQFHNTEHVEETLAKLNGMPAVKRVWPQRLYRVPDHKVSWTGSMPDAQAEALMKRQSNGSDAFTPHVMTQVNRLRDKGIVGKGIKVAVIDTGVDYKHPALGGCFGPGCLVSFGTDFVGDAYDGTNIGVPDNDPMDCEGHGTHVSGIIAAQTNNPFGIIGAATGVSMGHYRVFGCTGITREDVLIQAYNMAYQDGADLITASIGEPSGWADAAWSAAVTRIVAKGVPCVISAGNGGATGMFHSTGAADSEGATSIASFDNSIVPQLLNRAAYRADGGRAVGFAFTSGSPDQWGNVTLPLWSASLDPLNNATACTPLPYSTPDLSNFIVLIRRGTCFFDIKARHVRAKGARYLMFYNNVPGPLPVSLSNIEGVLGAGAVDAEQGNSWVSQLAAGRNLTLSITDPRSRPKFLLNTANPGTGGSPSTFTSWGPTWEGRVKPQLGAPGGNILSTFPLAKGGYAVMSGTSMACPLVAAVYALIMNVRGIRDPKTLENLVSATAKPALFNGGYGRANYLAPVPQQGGGLIQAWDAAYATTLLSASSLAFNDTDHFAPVQNFTISNNGSSSVTYALSTHGAATALTFSTSPSVIIKPAAFPNDMVISYANISFSEEKVEIAAGASRQISVTVTAPAGVDARRLPVYSGYVNINGTDGSSLSLPYMGILGSIKAQRTLDQGLSFLSVARTPANATQVMVPYMPAGHLFTMPPPGEANNTKYANISEMPRISIHEVWGTPLLRADIVALADNSTESHQPPPAAVQETEVLGLKVVGSLKFFPKRYQTRAHTLITWDGLLDTGKYLPKGRYKIVVRALRVFGDRENKEDYDSVETVPFKIRYLDP